MVTASVVDGGTVATRTGPPKLTQFRFLLLIWINPQAAVSARQPYRAPCVAVIRYARFAAPPPQLRSRANNLPRGPSVDRGKVAEAPQMIAQAEAPHAALAAQPAGIRTAMRLR